MKYERGFICEHCGKDFLAFKKRKHCDICFNRRSIIRMIEKDLDKLGILLPILLKRAVRQKCEVENKTFTAVVIHLLEQWVKE